MNYTSVIDWIKAAQDFGSNAGICAYLIDNLHSWRTSYPEVTGYTIPTLLAAGERERALKAAHWLKSVQFPNGALPAVWGTMTDPAPFDTAQVVRGWDALESDEFNECTTQAVQYLRNSWITDHWQTTQAHFLPTFHVLSVPVFTRRGQPIAWEMLDFFRSRIAPNGWPTLAEEPYPSEPLSHFVAYVAEGFLKCGEITLARKVTEGLLRSAKNGIVPARISSDWQAAADWVCVPGVAQTAILWRHFGMDKAYQQARKYLEVLDAPWGSQPVDSPYMPYCQVSWTAKYIADALKEE